MKTTKRSWLIRIAFILVLVLIAVLMLRIGRGHTVYFDNRAVDKGGQSVEAPYKITVYVNGEQLSKLYEKERCLTTVIGDKLELTVEVMQQKGGSETTETYQMTLPHNIDGIIINLPAYMAGLPEEAYLEEFIPRASHRGGRRGSAQHRGRYGPGRLLIMCAAYTAHAKAWAVGA